MSLCVPYREYMYCSYSTEISEKRTANIVHNMYSKGTVSADFHLIVYINLSLAPTNNLNTVYM